MAGVDVGQMHLNYFHFPTGHHEMAWRHPDSDSRHVLTIDGLAALAQTAEAACFDTFFLPYGYGFFGLGQSDNQMVLDPTLVMAAVAARTKHIGLVATGSTTFSQPFDVAQKFRTLDHLSNGRAAWNIVTSYTDVEAQNFGMESIPEHDERYIRAAEFADVCMELWDSWDDDALVIDKDAAVFADTGKVRAIDHHGDYYSVRGPLGLPPSPQRRPLLVQAGASEAGREFAARYAEMVVTFAPTLEAGQAVYTDMQQRLARAGRPAGAMKVMPGLAPVLGATEAQARELDREISELLIPERGLSALTNFTRMDFTGYSLDGPPPPLPDLNGFKGAIGRMKIIQEYVRQNQPTLRELALWFANEMRGHLKFVGTPERLAALMEEWLRQGGADGFTLMFPLAPRCLDDFARGVVPILQERGVLRTEYSGDTLRENFGLPLLPSVGAEERV